MKCPNCGYQYSNGSICPNCGVDIYIFRKTKNASIRLYNKGLQQAKNKDLYGASLSLEQSVLFDKNNHVARNLLGLVYCEKGQIADALKHWIVSASIYTDNNPAEKYMAILQKNGRTMEKNNDAVRFYNQALEYLRQGSEDLAVIQLKRALDFNKNFIKANNLMALCCIQENNYDRAKFYIQAVLQKDKFNPFATRYAHELNISTEQPLSKEERKKIKAIKKTDAPPPLPTYKRRDKQKGFIGKSEIIALFGGVAVTAVVLLVLVMPAMSDAKDKKIQELEKKYSIAAADPDQLPTDVTELRKQVESLNKEVDKYKTQLTAQTNLAELQSASNMMTNGDFEGASAKIIAIDPATLSDDQKAQYNSIKENSFPQAANNLYTTGKSEFLNEKFSEAQGHLENALKYASGEEFVDDAIYYLGKIAESKSDTQTAKTYYQRVLNEFPDSNQAANAQNALSQIQ